MKTTTQRSSLHIYKGVLIERQHSGTFRWLALVPGVQILRADTLAGMRQLITETLKRRNS